MALPKTFFRSGRTKERARKLARRRALRVRRLVHQARGKRSAGVCAAGRVHPAPGSRRRCAWTWTQDWGRGRGAAGSGGAQAWGAGNGQEWHGQGRAHMLASAAPACGLSAAACRASHTPREATASRYRILMRGCTRTDILHAVRFLPRSPSAEARTSVSKRLFVV